MPLATEIDALLQVDGLTEFVVPGGIARGNTPHGLLGLAVTTRAGSTRRRITPSARTIRHPQHDRVLRLIALKRLRGGTHKVKARTARIGRLRPGIARKRTELNYEKDEYRLPTAADRSHTTTSATRSVCAKPRSPRQLNTSSPLRSATIPKDR